MEITREQFDRIEAFCPYSPATSRSSTFYTRMKRRAMAGVLDR
jgi:hypothetical protein